MTAGNSDTMAEAMSGSDPNLRPLLAAMAGIALFSAMDVAIKGAALAIGAYSAYFLRCVIGLALSAPLWWWRTRRWPARAVMRVHLIRGGVVAMMGLTFFFALVRLPVAQAIAISFIAPLIALWLAAILLGEEIRREAIAAGIIGLAGVAVIVGGKIAGEAMDREAMLGVGAILLSALLYAWNLVLQRQQALVAKPLEVSTFQSGVAAAVLLLGAPFLFEMPQGRQWAEVGVGACFAVGASLMLAWAYARAETQLLVPIEYTGFVWAALFGWLYFGEAVTGATVAGALLIVIGCWIGTWRRRPEQSAL